MIILLGTFFSLLPISLLFFGKKIALFSYQKYNKKANFFSLLVKNIIIFLPKINFKKKKKEASSFFGQKYQYFLTKNNEKGQFLSLFFVKNIIIFLPKRNKREVICCRPTGHNSGPPLDRKHTFC